MFHHRVLTRIALAGTVLVAVAWLPADEPGAEPVKFLVQPYLQLPTPTSMSILWETDQKCPGRVEYGPTAEFGKMAEDRRELQLHNVTLQGLEPGSTYHYRVRSGGGVSGTWTFRTAPRPGSKRWKMVVYGDSRSFPAVHQQVGLEIAKAKPDLIVHTGDFVFNGKDRANWRKEFFEPLGDLLRGTPWVGTPGNHERNSAEYLSYVALPGNKRTFAFDYGNAHLVCLDSNSRTEEAADPEQTRWLTQELARPRPATWTFAVFHHTMFSAHATRPVDPLRLDWAPLLIDPAHKVDAVFTGHDHFYARNYRMGRVADQPRPGVLFVTTAGGGAPLYRTRRRDYVAREKSAHHFVVLDCDGDRITLTAIDATGTEIDRCVLTKEPTAAESYCSYEVEEARDFLRRALVKAQPQHLAGSGVTRLAGELVVPTRFKVPLKGKLLWNAAAGWTMAREEAFELPPGQPLKIPLRAAIAPGPFARTPLLTIEFAPGLFRNRTIEAAPFLLAGPEKVEVHALERAPKIDGRLDEPGWKSRTPKEAELPLLGLPPDGGRDDEVRLRGNRDCLYVAALLSDPAHRVKLQPSAKASLGDRGCLSEEHVHVHLVRGKEEHRFALTPEQVRFHEISGAEERPVTWSAAAGRGDGCWQVEMAIPRSLFEDWSDVRINVVHRRRGPDSYQELHLCPTWFYFNNPDRLPDIHAGERPEEFARLSFGKR